MPKMSAGSFLLAAAVTCVTVSAGPAMGQKNVDGIIVSRLMGEPLTLFDWGLAQLDRDMARTAARLLPGRADGPGVRHGTIFNWRSRRITMYLSQTVSPEERTRTNCANLFGGITRDLIIGATAGSDAAGWYLLNVFKPKAHFWGGRFEDIGAQLARIVVLEVSLIPAEFQAAAGDAKKVTCSGRLDASRESLEFTGTS